jgi:DNA-binding transcriptional ArsR family regulator
MTDAEGLAAIFSCMADPTRLSVLLTLLEGERCVCDLSEQTEASVSAVSHGLRLLRARRLVSRRRDGRHMYYRLADHHVEALLRTAIEHLEHI